MSIRCWRRPPAAEMLRDRWLPAETATSRVIVRREMTESDAADRQEKAAKAPATFRCHPAVLFEPSA